MTLASNMIKAFVMIIEEIFATGRNDLRIQSVNQ